MQEPRSSWLETRREGITGSDTAALLGLDPFRSRIEVWAEKVGLLRGRSLEEVERVKWGSILEGPVIREVLARTRRERVRAREWGALMRGAEIQPLEHRWLVGGQEHSRTKWLARSRSQPILLNTPDFALRAWRPLLQPGCEVQAEESGPGLGEIKTTSAFQGGAWRAGPPLRVQCQLQQGLLVAGSLSWGTVAVLIGGQQLLIFDQQAHGPFQRLIEEEAGEFWRRNVLAGIPPDVAGSAQEAEALAEIYSAERELEELAVLPAGDLDGIMRLRRRKRFLARLASDVKARETQLRARIGFARHAVVDGTGIGYSLKGDARGVRRLLPLKDGALVAPSGSRLLNDLGSSEPSRKALAESDRET